MNYCFIVLVMDVLYKHKNCGIIIIIIVVYNCFMSWFMIQCLGSMSFCHVLCLMFRFFGPVLCVSCFDSMPSCVSCPFSVSCAFPVAVWLPLSVSSPIHTGFWVQLFPASVSVSISRRRRRVKFCPGPDTPLEVVSGIRYHYQCPLLFSPLSPHLLLIPSSVSLYLSLCFPFSLCQFVASVWCCVMFFPSSSVSSLTVVCFFCFIFLVF